MTVWYKIKKVRIRQNWVEKIVRPSIPATAITLDKSSINMTTVGQTEQITATLTPADSTSSITWSSSDTTVATVSSTGLVTCVTPWSCTITATTNNWLTATCSITNWYSPTVNTVLYLPMKEDFLDKTGNNTMTNSWATIATLNWVKCWYFSNSILTCSANPLATTDRTISVRLYTTSGSWWIIWANHSWNATWDYTMIYPSWTRIYQSIYGWGATDSYSSYGVGINWWHHLCISWTKIYVDWTNVTTSEWRSGTYATWYPYTIGRQNSWANWYEWYMSELILENRVWTATEISDYYNQTKANYWL